MCPAADESGELGAIAYDDGPIVDAADLLKFFEWQAGVDGPAFVCEFVGVSVEDDLPMPFATAFGGNIMHHATTTKPNSANSAWHVLRHGLTWTRAAPEATRYTPMQR